jgi:hypothetical protein
LQSGACLVISSCGFLQVWPIQSHFLFIMQLLIGFKQLNILIKHNAMDVYGEVEV